MIQTYQEYHSTLLQFVLEQAVYLQSCLSNTLHGTQGYPLGWLLMILMILAFILRTRVFQFRGLLVKNLFQSLFQTYLTHFQSMIKGFSLLLGLKWRKKMNKLFCLDLENFHDQREDEGRNALKMQSDLICSWNIWNRWFLWGKVCDKMFGLMCEVTIFAAFCPPISVAGICQSEKRTQGQIKD